MIKLYHCHNRHSGMLMYVYNELRHKCTVVENSKKLVKIQKCHHFGMNFLIRGPRGSPIANLILVLRKNKMADTKWPLILIDIHFLAKTILRGFSLF